MMVSTSSDEDAALLDELMGMMDADEALASGLVARVVPDEDVLKEAMEAAETIASYSKPATKHARDAVLQAEELGLTDGVLWERDVFTSLFDTEDQRLNCRCTNRAHDDNETGMTRQCLE